MLNEQALYNAVYQSEEIEAVTKSFEACISEIERTLPDNPELASKLFELYEEKVRLVIHRTAYILLKM